MKFLSITALLALPALSLAQEFDQGGSLSNYLGDFVGFINSTLIPLLFAIAFLVFVFGIYKYFIQGGDDPDKRKEGQNLAIYAIVGFVLIISVFGIVNLLSGALNLQDGEDEINVPDTPGVGGGSPSGSTGSLPPSAD